ncbi:FtsX-like permease family protein [Mucilaginibacter sp.]|uniref:FtsX-like permease family protein n=1 Tax=Mucilaginibacter sp. TaxID=1882438 RepID=UPI002D1454E2|nr:FtsX-like permease family protein [Mucilaginibacter sp.]HTI61814.1 FtsX-like permease family protein [Mucilaginibacter sp.]
MFKNYLKTALRSFRRHKLFTFINIIGLAIGISAALVIFLIVDYDFTFNKNFREGDRIYRVVTDYAFQGEPFYNSGVCGPLPEAAKNEVTGLDAVAPLYNLNYKVTIQAKTPAKFKNQDVVYADKTYFALFPRQWLAGSVKNALNAPFQVVLSSKQAQKYFPSLAYDQIIGRQVVYEDTIRTTVTGIVAEPEGNTDLAFHDFISYGTMNSISDLKKQLTSWGGTTSSSQVFVKLGVKTSASNIVKQLNAILLKNRPELNKPGGYKPTFVMQPLSDLHFNAHYGAFDKPVANKTTLYLLIAVASFLLLLGCINFINLTTAQASERAKEIGIRKTMGSNRGQIITQYLSETFLVTLLAVTISIILAPFILKLFADFISPDIKFNLLKHPVLIGFMIVLTIVVSFVSGFYPALVLSKFRPVQVLKNQAYTGTNKTRNAWLRKSLTVTQFIIAQFFIMATVLVSKQIHYALHKDMGFRKDAIVNIFMPYNLKNKGLKDVYTEKIKQLPQVDLVSRGGDIPSTNGWSSNDVTYRDGKKEIRSELYNKAGDENYIKVYHIKLLAGRNVQLSDTATAMLVNENYAHLIGFRNAPDAVGKFVEFGNTDKRQIVGIFADFHQASLHAPIKPMAIFPQNYNSDGLHIALKPETAGGNEWKAATSAMETQWKQLFPDDDFQYSFFDESIAKMYTKEQQISKLLTWAMGLSIFISCLGLLGLAMFTTGARTKEIGVRKVLGATVSQIVTLLSTELVLLVLLAFVIVTPLAWYAMGKWIQNFADHTAVSWWVFALSGGGMLLTALLTLSFQTIKAAVANPVKSLRSE